MKNRSAVTTVLIFSCTAVIIVCSAYVSAVLMNYKSDSTTVNHTGYSRKISKTASENFSELNLAGSFDAKIPVVESTSISGTTLDSRSQPELAKFMETYAHYRYEKGVLGNPISDKLVTFSEGTYLPFTGQYADHTFHAITYLPNARNAYALWGVIGDYWIHGAEMQWGYPIGYETEQLDKGKIIISQSFTHGLVNYSNDQGISFAASH